MTHPVDELEGLLEFGVLRIEGVKGARFEEDLTREGSLLGGDGSVIRVKLRPATPHEEYNNIPRYDLAAYRLQRLFLMPEEYVVPPTALRAIDHETAREWGVTVQRTIRRADDVFFVVQYWVQNVTKPKDPYDPWRFEKDPVYARQVANLNILTFLIEHHDSNRGNLLVSSDPNNPRLFVVDNGISFGEEIGNRGSLWHKIRVPSLPADTVDRLRSIDRAALEAELLVVSQHRLDGRHFVPERPGPPLRAAGGCVLRDGVLQFGLKRSEIRSLERRLERLIRDVDSGEIGTF